MDEVKSLADANKSETAGTNAAPAEHKHVAKCNKCDKEATEECKFCGNSLCSEHARPKLVGDHTFVYNHVRKSEPDKFAEYEKDFRSKDGHPCAKYSESWNAEMDTKAKTAAVPNQAEHHQPAAQQTHEARTTEKAAPSKSKHTLQKAFRKLGGIRFAGISAKLNHYWTEYARVLHLARKPTRSEYRELAIMVIIGTAIIGSIGFVVQLAFQFI